MHPLQTAVDDLNSLCHQYSQAFGIPISAAFSDQLGDDADLRERGNLDGHLTSDAIVIDERKRVLLIKHKILGLRLAPGGHVERYETPVETAARELAEETGLSSCVLHPWHIASGIPSISIPT